MVVLKGSAVGVCVEVLVCVAVGDEVIVGVEVMVGRGWNGVAVAAPAICVMDWILGASWKSPKPASLPTAGAPYVADATLINANKANVKRKSSENRINLCCFPLTFYSFSQGLVTPISIVSHWPNASPSGLYALHVPAYFPGSSGAMNSIRNTVSVPLRAGTIACVVSAPIVSPEIGRAHV